MSAVAEMPRARPDVLALRLLGVSKTFGPVTALEDVNLGVEYGSVHAIVGENGAGKSTLLNIAAGILRPTAGVIEINGRTANDLRPATARAEGISVAFQHPTLTPDLTIQENLALVVPRLGRRAGLAEIEGMIERVSIPSLRMSPRARVNGLSLPQLYVAEIVRALATRPRILFLDEPTEPFQERSVERLFDLVRKLRDEGTAIVYVSHRLREVLEIADTISVLRDGQMIKTAPAEGYAVADVVTLIAGRPVDQMFPPKAACDPGEVVLEATSLSGEGFDDCSIAVRRGEIVGFAGIEGQGQRSFIRALAGSGEVRSGQIRVDGKPVAANDGATLRRSGLGFVPDDRHSEGLFLPLTIRENVSVGVVQSVARLGLINADADTRAADAVVATMGVKARSGETTVATLSGGNQQKVLLGREFHASPTVILVDEPTRGVDVGARSEIYSLLRKSADAGNAVVVSSSDGTELEGLCDRVLVFARGQIARELKGQDVTDTAITEANITLGTRRQESEVTRNGLFKRLAASLYFPAVILVLLTALLVTATGIANPYFFTAYNAASILQLLSILALVSIGQLFVMLMGEIDLSVGPLAGLVVVLASFFLGRNAGGDALVLGCVGILLFCGAFGLLQGVLVEFARLPSVVVTLSSFIGLQGVSLMLRPRPAGSISDDLTDLLRADILGIPASMIVAVAAILIFEWVLLRRPLGRTLRAVGSDAVASAKLGVNRRGARLAAFAASSILTGCAGIVLATQVGIGSATTGVAYTLQSITAVVLGGASVTGGVGSFISTLAAAGLIQVMVSATSFVEVGSAWQYWLVGGATLAAAALFSIRRRRRTAH
jgi:ribose transport system ATP-binding protein